MKLPLLLGLIFLSSCKGQRFYWETRFLVSAPDARLKDALVEKFRLTGKLSDWHPVFGQYCVSLPSLRAHLFVCWKNQELRVASSYSGSVKGDGPVWKNPSTVSKYLRKISDQPGSAEHAAINEYIHRAYKVLSREDRLLSYGRGSIMMKEELAGESSALP